MKKLLFVLPSFGLGGTEKTAQIYLKYFKEEFDVYACAINKSGPREYFFKENSKAIFVCYGDLLLLKDFVIREGIDIVYLHINTNNKKFIGLVDILSEFKKLNIRIIQTSPFSLFSPNVEKYIDQKLFVSKTSLLKFLWRFRQPKKTKYNYLYNPIDCKYLEQFRLTTKERLNLRKKHNLDNKFVIGKVGRADIWKRDDTVINILPDLIKHIPNIIILVRSIPESKLKKIQKKKIEKYFLILPESADEKEIAETYQLMDIMLHTSRIGESFGITLVEGMFFGLPIITNSTDRMQRTIYDRDNSQSEIIGKDNFVINKKKYIIQKIIELKENKKMYKNISKNNIIRVINKFDVNILKEDLKNFLIDKSKRKDEFCFLEEIKNYKKNRLKESFFKRLFLSFKAIYEKILLS